MKEQESKDVLSEMQCCAGAWLKALREIAEHYNRGEHHQMSLDAVLQLGLAVVQREIARLACAKSTVINRREAN